MYARSSLRSPGPEHSKSNSFHEHPHEANGLNKEELRKGVFLDDLFQGNW